MTLLKKSTSRLVEYLNGRTQFTKKLLLLVTGSLVAIVSLRLIIEPGTSDDTLLQPQQIIQPPLQHLQDSTNATSQSPQLNKTDSL